jgi:quinol monooxygenase YgiN
MVIVGGWFEVDPGERDAFVAGQVDAMRRSRAEQGCIEYVIAADPVETGRAVLFERWASQEDLDAHLAGLATAPKSDGPQVAPTGVSIVVYDVSGERTLA